MMEKSVAIIVINEYYSINFSALLFSLRYGNIILADLTVFFSEFSFQLTGFLTLMQIMAYKSSVLQFCSRWYLLYFRPIRASYVVVRYELI